MGIWYATREDVKRALDIAETALSNGQVDRAINSASRSVEGLLKRRFYPQAGTRFFDWPDRRRPRTWRLWLDGDEVISVDTLTAGGVEIPAGAYFLEPANSGPPFTHIEVDLASTSAFSSGDTHQRAITVAGVFGYTADTEPAGALAAAVDALVTTVDVTDSAAVGVGSIILVDDEYAIVTGRAMLDTGRDIEVGGDLEASKADVSVAVTSASDLHDGETILIDAERMLITDIAGNNLIVRRAWDGSVLAAHAAGASLFAPRRLTVTRGALGTTAAAHALSAAVLRHEVPGLVRELAIAEAINTVQQEQSAYGRTIGSGENERESGGRGLVDIRKEARARYGRKSRTGAV